MPCPAGEYPEALPARPRGGRTPTATGVSLSELFGRKLQNSLAASDARGPGGSTPSYRITNSVSRTRVGARTGGLRGVAGGPIAAMPEGNLSTPGQVGTGRTRGLLGIRVNFCHVEP